MPTRVSRLSLKLMLVTLAALVLLAATIVPLVANRFRHTQREVTRRSTAGLEAQGSAALQRLTEREVTITATQLQRGAITSRQAADYLAEAIQAGSLPAEPAQLARGPDGQYYDPDPSRRSDVFVPNTVAGSDPAIARDLRESAALDPLFATLLANYPDAVTISYLSSHGLVRAYPITDLARIVPPDYAATAAPSFAAAAPAANPAHVTVWRAPFSDPTGQGLLVTASTPVYAGGEFRGVVVVNISLRSLIDHLYAQKPTLNGYAFLIDDGGHLIAAPPAALAALVGPGQGGASPSLRSTLGLSLVAGDPALQQTFEGMRRGQQGIDQVLLGGQPVLLAYGPLANVGWRLGLVAPLAEITAESAVIDRAIGADADATLASTLVLMGVVFLLTLIATAAIGRQLLTRPIAALAAGTRAIASGHLDVKIPADRRDELGDLAGSFNRMTGEIAIARDGLERRSAELIEANTALEAEVSERRRAEEALQEREAQYRSIFEETSDGIVISEPGGGIVEVNPAMCHLHGYTREEMLGLAPALLVRPEDRQIVPESVEAIREHGQFQTRAIALRKDGSSFHIEVHSAGFLYKGRPHILSVIRDVSEQMAAYELLESRVAERTRELTTLLRIAHDVASTLELGPLLGLILDRLGTVVDYSAASISTVGGAELVQVEYRGPQPQVEIVPRRVPLAATNELWARLGRREVLTIDDLRKGGPVVQDYGRLFPEGHPQDRDNVRAWLGVPLLTQDRPIGLLVIASGIPGYYTAAHRRVVAAVAAQAAVAIENARLYEQAGSLAALEERQRLARELHDSVSQALYGIALGSKTARTLLDRDPTKLAAPLDYILQLAEAGLTEMRAFIFELRPESLANEGLVVALNKQAAALSARHGLTVEADLGVEPDVPIDTKEALYRVAQEALHNIVKHARARHAEVRLRCDDAACVLEICDDGVGFDAGGSFPGHLGLRSMHERAARLGGTLAIESAPDTGTRLTARLPHRDQPAITAQSE